MKIVYRAENIIDANLVKNALEQVGIAAFVSGQYLTGAIGELPVQGLVNVMVATVDYPKALVVAEHIDAALSERRAQPDGADGWVADPV